MVCEDLKMVMENVCLGELKEIVRFILDIYLIDFWFKD